MCSFKPFYTSHRIISIPENKIVSKRRVVVTGMGMLSPVGNNVESSWKALLAGQSGIVDIEHFDTENFSTRFAGLVKDFDCTEYMSKKDARKMDLFIQYGIAAGIQALDDSGLQINEENAARVGVAIGSGIGGLDLIEAGHTALVEKGPRKVSPFFVPSTIVNMVAGNLSIMRGLRGPNIAISTACTTGLHNIGHAARMIAYGDAEAMVAGGAEKASTPLGMAGFGAAKALSTRNDEPQKASRPWDKDRDGFVLGDGAGIIVLEEYEHAKARGAKIYAELVGFGMSGDAFHMTSPSEDGSGGALAMEAAMRDAGITGTQVGYVNAHGTSTPAGDVAEVKGIRRALGEEGTKQVKVSSTKSMTGHLLGAAGSVEAIVTIMSLVDQMVPPTINLDNRDEGLDDIDLVPHKAKPIDSEYAICNSFGFGGTNGSLVFKKI
nr:beta-ketoacyl-ACP synthase II [Vibrio coralliilyticus]